MLTLSTWNLKLADGSAHFFKAFDFYNASRMAIELKNKQFPDAEISGIEKASEDANENVWEYPFNT